VLVRAGPRQQPLGRRLRPPVIAVAAHVVAEQKPDLKFGSVRLVRTPLPSTLTFVCTGLWLVCPSWPSSHGVARQWRGVSRCVHTRRLLGARKVRAAEAPAACCDATLLPKSCGGAAREAIGTAVSPRCFWPLLCPPCRTLDVLSRNCPRLSFLSMMSNPACPNELVWGKDEDDYLRYRAAVLGRLQTLSFLDSVVRCSCVCTCAAFLVQRHRPSHLYSWKVQGAATPSYAFLCLILYRL